MTRACTILLNAAVQPKALQVVDEIVAAGNGSEKVLHLCHALRSGLVEHVAHPIVRLAELSRKTQENPQFVNKAPFATRPEFCLQCL